jgi:hypothetical protein
MKMKAADSSVLVPIYQTTQHHIPGDCHLIIHRPENFKPQAFNINLPSISMLSMWSNLNILHALYVSFLFYKYSPSLTPI